MGDSPEATDDNQPDRMEPENKLVTNFKIPKKRIPKRKSSTTLSGSQKSKIRITAKNLEEDPEASSDLQNELQSSEIVQVAEKNIDTCDLDDDCLSILCTSSLFSDVFSDKPVITQRPFQTKKRNLITYHPSETEIESDCRVNITERIPPTKEFHYENKKNDSGFEDCPSCTEVARLPQRPLSRNNYTDLKTSSQKIVTTSSAKLSGTTSPAITDVRLKRANLESRIGNIWNTRITNLRNLLDTCKNWECDVRNLHEIPNNSGNLSDKRAEELRRSFIDHLPLLIDLIFGRNVQLSGRSHYILIEQLLEAIKVSLESDVCQAISILLHKAITVFTNHYKIIHNILGGCIRHNKDIKNILEAVRPLLSLPRFHWPLWLQERIVRNLIDNNAQVSEQDYSALFEVLSSHLFDQLPRPQRTLNLISARKRLQLENVQEKLNQSESAFLTLRSVDSQSKARPLMECRGQSPRNAFIAMPFNGEFPLPISPSLSSPTFSQSNNIPNQDQDHSLSIYANNGLKLSNVITDLVLTNRVHSAIDILKKFDLDELFKVAHNLFIQRSVDYVNVVQALMSYLKNRSFMHLLNRRLNIFMSTLSFNLLVKFIKDETLEKALSFFHDIRQTGFEYLHAQLFPESLGEVDCPSQMKTILIAVDLCINSDNYDQAAQIFIDNGLLGDISQWKLSSTSDSDIELRDRYISHIFSLLLEDNRAQMTMLAGRLFTEMQKQRSPFSSNSAQMIRLLTKLLTRSAWNKLAYDIFMKFYSMSDISSKCTLAVSESAICRAMLVISHSIDPDNTSSLLQDFLEWDVYPIWKLEDNTIIVHTNWVRIEIEILLNNHIQRLVNRLKLPAFGFSCKELSIMVEEFANEEAIVALQKVDSSFNVTVDELREILYSLNPPIRSIAHKRKLITVQKDWIRYLDNRISNSKPKIQSSAE